MKTKNYFLCMALPAFLLMVLNLSTALAKTENETDIAKNNADINVKISKLTVKIGKTETKIAKEEQSIAEANYKIEKEEKSVKGMNVAYLQMVDDTPDKAVDKAKLKKQIEESGRNVADYKLEIAKRELTIAESKREIFDLNTEIKGLKRRYQ